MLYKILSIEDNILTLEDQQSLDEWGNPTLMEFTVNDTSIFKVNDTVKIMIIKTSNGH